MKTLEQGRQREREHLKKTTKNYLDNDKNGLKDTKLFLILFLFHKVSSDIAEGGGTSGAWWLHRSQWL